MRTLLISPSSANSISVSSLVGRSIRATDRPIQKRLLLVHRKRYIKMDGAGRSSIGRRDRPQEPAIKLLGGRHPTARTNTQLHAAPKPKLFSPAKATSVEWHGFTKNMPNTFRSAKKRRGIVGHASTLEVFRNNIAEQEGHKWDIWQTRQTSGTP